MNRILSYFGRIFAIALLSTSPTLTFRITAASPPAVTLLYTAPGPVAGGIAVGNSGFLYFATLGAPGNGPRVIGLYSAGVDLWTPWLEPNGQNIWPIPMVSPTFSGSSKLFFGSDAGVFYSLEAATGVKPASWNHYVVPTGTDKRIHSGAAWGQDTQGNPTAVYFHCNNGYLYALNPTTGAKLWEFFTGNSAPSTTVDHTETWSSSPVVGTDGTIYVGSANGNVYAVNPNGTARWANPVVIGTQIEASLAIGENGWLYGATRLNATLQASTAFAINPTTAAIVWSQDVTGSFIGPGVVASPVIDQGGVVYIAEFDDFVRSFDAITGTPLKSFQVFGKFCQTPSINQDGLMIVGTSKDSGPNPEKRAIRAFHTGQAPPMGGPVPPLWSIPEVPLGTGQPVSDFLGCAAIRVTSSGTTYIADMSGKIYRFNSGARLMAGQWPTFQCGNRRLGRALSYPIQIFELPSFANGEPSTYSIRSMNFGGKIAGQASGDANGVPTSGGAAVWEPYNGASILLTCPSAASPIDGTFASAVNWEDDVVGLLLRRARGVARRRQRAGGDDLSAVARHRRVRLRH